MKTRCYSNAPILGKTRIPVDALIKLAKFYDVDMNYICGLSEKRGRFKINYAFLSICLLKPQIIGEASTFVFLQ